MMMDNWLRLLWIVRGSGGAVRPRGTNDQHVRTVVAAIVVLQCTLLMMASAQTCSTTEIPSLCQVGGAKFSASIICGGPDVTLVPCSPAGYTVTDMIFVGCPITFGANVFTASGYTQLNSVDIQTDAPVYIAPGAFSGQSSLEILEINVNALPAGLFSGLTSLMDLGIVGTVSTIPASIFQGISIARALNIATGLTSIPSGLFSGQTSIQSLGLANNALNSVGNSLVGMTSLTELSLENNLLTSVDASIFQGLPLTKLFLSGNLITTIQTGAFAGLSCLVVLQLQQNPLMILAPFAFQGLNPAVHLTLGEYERGGSAAFVQESAFVGVGLVRLAGQKVLYLSPTAFGANPPSTFICGDYQPNPHPTLPPPPGDVNTKADDDSDDDDGWKPTLCATDACILACPNASLCVVNHNILPTTTFICQPDYCSYLEVEQSCVHGDGSIDCSYRNLEILPCIVPSKTAALYLQGNSVNFIDSRVFNGSGYHDLQELDLAFNNITSLQSQSFSNLSSLTSLYLTGNPISGIAESAFVGLSKLKNLYISSLANLTIVPNAFAGLTSKTNIYLAGQYISSIASNAFPALFSTFFCGSESWMLEKCTAHACLKQCGLGSTCIVNGFLHPDTEFTCANSTIA